MAHFAELDQDNIVTRVLVIADKDCRDSNGLESEPAGAAFCAALFGGRFIQTSYSGRIRKRFAGIGDTYDAALDAFIRPRPYPSWTLDESADWAPPVPYPDGGSRFVWDEATLSWKAA